MEPIGKALSSAPTGSLKKLNFSSVQVALDQRMTLTEALKIVKQLISAYPNGGANASDGYFGALASVLGSYPRAVGLRCADPIRGVCRESKFLPTVADLIAWCERETEPMRREVEYERRVEEQLRERERWQKQAKPDQRRKTNGMTYGEFLAHCEKNGLRPRPVGAFEKGGYLGGSQ